MFRTDIGRQILPVVVAHRGASASYPENTLASFQGAIDAGADIVELDVRLSADGVPVIMHNAEVDATTDGSGWVHELTVAELKRLDASRGRGSRAEIPTLEEAFRFLSGKAGINVEIKNMPGEPAFDSPREAAAEQVVILLHRIGFDGPMLVSSFNWLSIERVNGARTSGPHRLPDHRAVRPIRVPGPRQVAGARLRSPAGSRGPGRG